MSYDLFIEREVHAARHDLPGNMRQRIQRIINDLATSPRPPESEVMNTEGLNLRGDVELRRLRIERWRIIYAVCDIEQWVWILALRRRPPYNYKDIPELIARLRE